MNGRLRLVSYNVHKCRGLDFRTRPARILGVLRELDADVVALQEVWSQPGSRAPGDQAAYLAAGLGLHCCFGENRLHRGGRYGNALLSRFPIALWRNYDITHRGREPRGCLRADLELGSGAVLHVFNVHLGTAFWERRHQGEKLIGTEILNSGQLAGARLVLGDFNEWTTGLATRLLRAHLMSPSLARHPGTYPGLLPLLHLDHIYHDPALALERLFLHRTRSALIASDHLPLVADFRLPA